MSYESISMLASPLYIGAKLYMFIMYAMFGIYLKHNIGPTYGAKYDVMQYALRLYSPKMHICRNLNITFHFLFLAHVNKTSPETCKWH